MIHKAKRAYRTSLSLGKKHARRHWERYGLIGIAIQLVVLIITIQLVYPWNSLPMYATIGGMNVGGQPADKVVKTLDDAYSKTPIALYFGNSPKAYRQPLPSDIGLTISSQQQVSAAVYPVWLRFIPTSLWWAHSVLPAAAPSYHHDAQKAGLYVQKELGESCNVAAENASLTYKDKKLQVVPAIDGGTCKLADVEALLNSAQPNLSNHKLHIPMNQHPAAIHDGIAKSVADRLMAQTNNISIKAGDSSVTVPQDTFLSWLDFSAPDSGIVASINPGRAADFFSSQLAPKVTVKAGTSHITTLDFTELSRTEGAFGQALDNDAMVKLLNQWLGDGNTELSAPVKPVAPTPLYIRTYTQTDTGLAALLAQFAQSHPGTFGVSYMELDGQHRHAVTMTRGFSKRPVRTSCSLPTAR